MQIEIVIAEYRLGYSAKLILLFDTGSRGRKNVRTTEFSTFYKNKCKMIFISFST